MDFPGLELLTEEVLDTSARGIWCLGASGLSQAHRGRHGTARSLQGLAVCGRVSRRLRIPRARAGCWRGIGDKHL